MFAGADKFSKVNLLPKDIFEASLLGKSLRWSLTAGKAIVILTEFVVILAFASRFWFDKKLNDLRESNDMKQTIVQSYVDTEEQMREILLRQEAVDVYLTERLDIEGELNRLRRLLPVNTSLTKVSFSKDGLGIFGNSGSGRSLAQTISLLKSNKRVAEIDIRKVEFNQKKGAVEFEIITRFKREGK